MGKTVLLVEDELFVALDVQDTLEQAGWTVDGPYATMSDAMIRLSTATHVCAVLDVRLKDGEVYPVADELASQGIPIVFHSGHAEKAVLRQRYPLASVCSKPCLPETLQDEVEKAIEASVKLQRAI